MISRSPINRRVLAAIMTASGSARAAASKAARLGVSPTNDDNHPGGDAYELNLVAASSTVGRDRSALEREARELKSPMGGTIRVRTRCPRWLRPPDPGASGSGLIGNRTRLR
jgi:hypothetical protein